MKLLIASPNDGKIIGIVDADDKYKSMQLEKLIVNGGLASDTAIHYWLTTNKTILAADLDGLKPYEIIYQISDVSQTVEEYCKQHSITNPRG